MNSDWQRAVLGKYKPPVFLGSGNFARVRLVDTLRMFSAGILRLSPMSMPFAARFLRGSGILLNETGRSVLSGKAGATALSGICLSDLGKDNSPSRMDVQGGVCSKEQDKSRRHVRIPPNVGGFPRLPGIGLLTSRKTLADPVSVRRQVLLSVLFREGAGEKTSLSASGIVLCSHSGDTGISSGYTDVFGEQRTQDKARMNMIPALQQVRNFAMPMPDPVSSVCHRGMRLEYGDEPSGKGRPATVMKSPEDCGNGAMALRMKNDDMPGPCAEAGAGSIKGTENSRSVIRSEPFSRIPALSDRPSVGSSAFAQGKASPVFGKSEHPQGHLKTDLMQGSGMLKSTPGIGIFRDGYRLESLLYLSAMGITSRPVLMRHVMQLAGENRGCLNITSPVPLSRTVQARTVIDETGEPYNSATGISRQDLCFGNPGESGMPFHESVSLKKGSDDVRYGHRLQAQEKKTYMRYGAPVALIFRKVAKDMLNVSDRVSEQQDAPFRTEGGYTGGDLSLSQTPSAVESGLEREAEDNTGASGEVDLERLVEEVCLVLERRLAVERESRGL